MLDRNLLRGSKLCVGTDLVVLGQLVRLWLILGQDWHDKSRPIGNNAVFEQLAVVAIISFTPLLLGAGALWLARFASLALGSVTAAAVCRIHWGKVPEGNAGRRAA